MRNARFRFLALVVTVFLVSSVAPVQAQGTFAHGAVVALQDTPHLWFADEHGVLHWGGDTRALAGRHIDWSSRVEVNLRWLRTLPVGDPWLSAGLLKDGDPIYLVKWESNWEQPQLLHIQSIRDVELFGINGSNYGKFVIEKNEWERRFGISAADLQRGVLASAVTPVSVTSPALEREALVALYNATDGANWERKQNWLSDAPLHLWYGVIKTDATGRVTRLNLSSNGLKGPLPAELGNLTNLVSLEIGNNNLIGPIPTEVGNLMKLRALGLHNNNLTGPIPVELGGWTSLDSLALGGNNLTGPIPAELGNLMKLSSLGLYDNSLTGPIPAQLGSLTNLRWLGLNDNSLTGPIPAELGDLTSLRWLHLSGNSLTGPLPASLTALTKLRTFNFNDTGLCAPANDAFGAWIGSIDDVEGQWGCPAS